MRVEWDKSTGTITVGKAVFEHFVNFSSSAEWATHVLRQNGRLVDVFNTKEQNKKVADILGCSRATLFKHFCKLQNKVFVAPIYGIVKRVSPFKGGKMFDANTVNRVNRHKEILLEVYKDGLYNLLPIVVVTGLTPAQLKRELKGRWKAVANNSLNKNNALARHFEISGLEEISMAASYPTTLLKHRLPLHCISYLTNNFKGKWGDKKEMARQCQFLNDTGQLAEKLGKEVGKNWSERRMKEEHDKMSKEALMLKYSKTPFKSLEDCPVKSHSVGEYTATLLDSAFAIAEEGRSMSHCVAMYASSVCNGGYLVYSVTKAGEKSSTIGVDTPRGCRKRYAQNQHYRRFNEVVKEPHEVLLGQRVVEMLNSSLGAAQ